jgi:hypothetical protein
MMAALQNTPSDETYCRRCSECATQRQLMYVVCNEVVCGFGEGEKDAAWLLQCKDSAHSTPWQRRSLASQARPLTSPAPSHKTCYARIDEYTAAALRLLSIILEA